MTSRPLILLGCVAVSSLFLIPRSRSQPFSPSEEGGSTPGPAAAMVMPTPADDWTVITCDGNMLVDYENNQVTFFHNVLVKNPRGSMRADRLIIFFSPQGEKIERTEGEGNVNVKMGERTGTSDKLLYFPDQRKAVLDGRAVVREGEHVVRGEKITFYLDKKEMEVEAASKMKIAPGRDYDVN